MRSGRLGLLFCFLISLPMRAQNSQATESQATPGTVQQSQRPALPPASKDPQAINIINEALNAVGGATAVAAITDYAGTGNITYHMDTDRDVQATVRIQAQGLNRFRMDTTTASGERSEVTDGPMTTKDEDGVVRKSHNQSPLAPTRLVLPYLQLVVALTSNNLNVVYKGTLEVDSRPAHDIQIQHILPGDPNHNRQLTEALDIDFFVDTSTLQVVMMQDFVSKSLVRQIRYFDFRFVGSVSLPFSVAERVRNQDIWLMQLGQIHLNSGIQASDFKL
jgi:hypothetical protein